VTFSGGAEYIIFTYANENSRFGLQVLILSIVVCGFFISCFFIKRCLNVFLTFHEQIF